MASTSLYYFDLKCIQTLKADSQNLRAALQWQWEHNDAESSILFPNEMLKKPLAGNAYVVLLSLLFPCCLFLSSGSEM